jgi:hypothetical protein
MTATTPVVDPIARLQSAAQSLAGAPFPGPRRTALLARFYRVLAPVLEEREQLRARLDHGYDRIGQERAALGVPVADGAIEPADARYQRAVDRWAGWLARYQAIEDALDAAAKTGGVRL